MAQRHLLDDEARGHDVVRHGQRVRVHQVHLVLAGGGLMVGRLDGDAHLAEVEHRLTPKVRGDIARRLVEIAASVDSGGVIRALEVEKLNVRSYVELQAQTAGLLHALLEDVAGIAVEGRVLRGHDVAEHAGHGVLSRAPGEDAERGGVRQQHHVPLGVPGETLDGRAVEGHAAHEGVLKRLHGDGDALDVAQDVRKPETNKLDVLLPGGVEDVVNGLAFAPQIHSTYSKGETTRGAPIRKRPSLVSENRLHVHVQEVLVGVGAQAHRAELPLPLIVQPGADDVRGEHVAAEQEVVVLLQGP